MMRRAAEILLRRALAEGTVTIAELQGFGLTDYAGVARILKLDPGLNEVVVAVKLQEIGGAAILAMQPIDFASALSLTEAQQGERLEAFLSALKEVAADPSGGAQQQQATAAAADAAGTGTATTTRKKKRTDPEAAAAVALPRKTPAISKGLRGPRVSGLKKPAPTVSIVESAPAAPDAVVLPVATAAARADATQLQQRTAELPIQQEGQNRIFEADYSKRQRQKGEERHSKGAKGKPRGKREVKEPRMEQDQQQLEQQETGSRTKDKSRLQAKLMAWAASILSLKGRFDSVLREQAAYRNKRALLSTTGFREGAGVQNELPALVRRLGALAGVSVAFEWKPQYPEKITHVICSDELLRPTVKLYFALVNGGYILTEEFLRQAKKQKAWPDPKQFQRPDFPSVELRGKSRWLLKSLPVCIDGPYRPSGLSKQQLQTLVIAAGGALRDDASATVRVLEDAEALRRRQARGLWGCQPEGTAQPFPICAQWLLDCIRSWQLLPRDQYVLSLASVPSNKSCEHTTEAGQRKRRKETKTGSNAGQESKMRRDCVEEGCDGVSHNKALKSPQKGVATVQITVKKLQDTHSGLPCAGAASGDHDHSAAQSIHAREGLAENSNPVLPKAQQADAPVAKGVAQKVMKARSSGKRLRSVEKQPHENASRNKKIPPPPAKGKKDVVRDALPESGEVVASAGDEAVPAALGAAPTSEQQSVLTDRPTAGAASRGEGCSGRENGLAGSPVVDDWEPPDKSPPPDETAAAEAVAFSAAAPAASAAAECPQRECPASTSQVTAAGDSFQLPGEHLDVVGLFEPDEADTAEYNFDIKDQCSLQQKLDDVPTNQPANTQRETRLSTKNFAFEGKRGAAA
ncbi:hypothetical protein, conserved [Eimeria brunetti]|uniref:BRCT domain-containing protein n=1 Tax=Eimeria brunetti TaxID=51314 RepID=U6LER8_9EIME|nr:hypothetical protein, conserved [Eimeria brunetti]